MMAVDVYVARSNAIDSVERAIRPADLGELPVVGIVVHYSPETRRRDLRVGEAIPWFVD